MGRQGAGGRGIDTVYWEEDPPVLTEASVSRGGGRLQYEMPGCVCWGSENVPIIKDALCQKPYPY